jgi:hypothetical protein
MFYRIPEGNRMAMGTRQQRERRQGLWIPAADIHRGGGHFLFIPEHSIWG